MLSTLHVAFANTVTSTVLKGKIPGTDSLTMAEDGESAIFLPN